MSSAPGAVCAEILALAAVRVIDAAVEAQFTGAALDFHQRRLRQQRDGIVIELLPAQWVEIVEQADGILVPTPPEIPGQRPEPLLGGSDKAVESAGLADYRRHLGGCLRQH